MALRSEKTNFPNRGPLIRSDWSPMRQEIFRFGLSRMLKAELPMSMAHATLVQASDHKRAS